VSEVFPEAKFAARLGAVQALYQMEASQIGVEAVIREFEEHRFHHLAKETGIPPHREHFSRVVHGVLDRQTDIDRGIDSVLKAGWPIARLDATVRAILRAGAFELLACSDVPARAALNEYLDVAHAFYSGEEIAFINGVLDQLAKRWRAEGERDTSESG